VLGWATCLPLFSVFVWRFGTLKLLEPIPHHPRDRALLNLGRILGILHVGLSISAFVAVLFVLLLKWIATH
jgi:hypothetical protein